MIVPKPLHDSGRPIHGNSQMSSKTVRQEKHIYCKNSWVALQMHASLSGTSNLLSMLKRSSIYTYPPSDRRQAQSSWPWRDVSAGRVSIVLCLLFMFTSCEKSTSCAHQCWMKQHTINRVTSLHMLIHGAYGTPSIFVDRDLDPSWIYWGLLQSPGFKSARNKFSPTRWIRGTMGEKQLLAGTIRFE